MRCVFFSFLIDDLRDFYIFEHFVPVPSLILG